MRNKICWNNGWRFFRKDQPAAETLAAGEAVTLPHTWNAKDGQDGGNGYGYGDGYGNGLNLDDLFGQR